jgi:hypothetical protein
LDVILAKRQIVYYREGSSASSPKVAGYVKLMFKVVFTKFVAPLPFNLH